MQARADLRVLCRQPLSGRREAEVIDVLHEPQRAPADGVYLTPMLVKLAPDPVRRVAGDVSEPAPLLAALDLTGGASKP